MSKSPLSSHERKTATPVAEQSNSRVLPLKPEIADREAFGEAMQLKRNAENAQLMPGAMPQRQNVLQRKGQSLHIGDANDAAEQEADSVANHVLKMPMPDAQSAQPRVQAQEKEQEQIAPDQHAPASPQGKQFDTGKERLQRKPQIQAKANAGVAGGKTTPASVQQGIASSKGGGSSLDEGTKSEMEGRFGQSFDGVRIHTGSEAEKMSTEVQAKAFTVGQDIYFNQGEFQPETQSGQHLLAHELTHTIQQGAGDTLRRTPDLTLPEIDPTTQPSLDMNDEFQWQNKALLDTVFNDPKSEGNDRLLALRSFLLLQKELELNAKVPQLSATLTPDELKAVITEQITSVETEIKTAEKAEADAAATQADAKAKQPAAKLEMEAAKKALAALLKSDPRAKELVNLRAEVKKKQDKAKGDIGKADQNISWLKTTGRYVTDPTATVSDDQKFWDSRKSGAQKVIDDEQKKVTETDQEFDMIVGPTQRDFVAKTETLEKLKQEEKESKARREAAAKLIKDLKSLLETIKKAEKGDPNALRNFKMKSYERELNDMNHGELFEEAVELFDEDDAQAKKDPAYVKRFPDWQRYAVIHYSGMRYRNAHGSWFDPTKILKQLRTKELAANTPEQKRMMQAEAAKTADKGTLKAEKINAKTQKAMAEVQPDVVKKALKGDDKTHYNDVLTLESSLNALLLELQNSGSDPKRTAEIRTKIAEIDKEMEAMMGKMSDKGRDVVKKAMAKKAAALQQIAEERAMNKIKALSSGQAFGVLKAMHDKGQIPEVVWRELLAFTEGRVQTQDQAWEANLKLKDAKGSTPEEEASLRAWEAVIKDSGFYSNSTGWREQHSKTLAPTIVSSLVCDQLGSQLQHLRGHKRPGGLRNNAMYYKGEQDKGTSGAYFKNPTSKDDLKVGASIYWFDWTENSITEEYAALWEKQKYQKAVLTNHERQRDDQAKIMNAKNPKDDTKFLHSQSKRDAAEKKWGEYNQLTIEDHDKLKEMETQEKAMKVWAPEKDKLPDISNIVSPTLSGDDIAVGNLPFKNNSVDKDGWTYRALDQDIPVMKGVTKNAKVLMRVKPNPFFKDRKIDDSDFSFKTDEQVLKQWMGWTHEATVMYADDSITMTFDTSGNYQGKEIKGMSARKRQTSSLVGNKNVFVGYAPDANPPGFETPFTDFDSSSMSTEAYEMHDKK